MLDEVKHAFINIFYSFQYSQCTENISYETLNMKKAIFFNFIFIIVSYLQQRNLEKKNSSLKGVYCQRVALSNCIYKEKWKLYLVSHSIKRTLSFVKWNLFRHFFFMISFHTVTSFKLHVKSVRPVISFFSWLLPVYSL